MNDSQIAECARILGQALIEMADVLSAQHTAEGGTTPSGVAEVKSVRNNPVRKDGSAKMWARDADERVRALATLLGAFVRNGGVLDKEVFKATAKSVGYDTRGLASLSTQRVNLVKRDPADPSNSRILTDKGQRRYEQIARYDRHNAA